MKKFIVLSMIIPLLNFCKEPLQYKYLEDVRVVQCEGADIDLMHEAYYSFRDDIYEYYNYINKSGEYNFITVPIINTTFVSS